MSRLQGIDTVKDYIDESNKVVYKIIKSIIDGEIKTIQLFIEGSSGSGKTHIVNYLKSECKQKKVFIINSIDWISEYVKHKRNNDVDLFKGVILNNDILVIEDIYFISGKERLQRELLEIVEECIKQNKTVILTSEKSIDQIDLYDALRSELKSFISIRIKGLGVRGKSEYIQDFLKQKNVNFSEEEINKIIADSNNYRELNGNLNKLYLKMQD